MFGYIEGCTAGPELEEYVKKCKKLYTICTSMSVPQSQRWSLKPTLDLDTDNFQS